VHISGDISVGVVLKETVTRSLTSFVSHLRIFSKLQNTQHAVLQKWFRTFLKAIEQKLSKEFLNKGLILQGLNKLLFHKSFLVPQSPGVSCKKLARRQNEATALKAYRISRFYRAACNADAVL